MKPRISISIACAIVASFVTISAASPRITSSKQKGSEVSEPAAQTNSKRPALVIGIVVDGLDLDRIHQLREFFGQNGFNRLLNNGVTINDLDYGSPLDETAATAVIYTGASPAVTGIASSTIYDPAGRRAIAALTDSKTIGNFTDETYSPERLRISTLTDELRIDNGGLGSAHSISPDPQQAIIMAGHAGNTAAWINDKTGKWATTTYYKDVASSINTINRLFPLASRLDTVMWNPSLPQGVYDYLPAYKKIYSFSYTYPRNDINRYEAFKASAAGNAEITAVATDYVKSASMGKGSTVDMLNINYTLQPYAYATDPDARAEQLDMYMRLDGELDRLFKYVDASGPGMDRTLVFVVGTPLISSQRKDDEKFRIPTGEFSPSRALSLLKVNLMSLYGNGEWVTGYHNGQFYLNHELIKERGKDINEFRRETADFLRRLSGVNYAATIEEVVADNGSADSPFPPARNIDIDSAGDVFIAVAPGWCITDNGEPNSKNQRVVRATGNTSSAFILYPKVDARTIDTPVDARVIAPTVARLLRIRSPNGAQLPPLRLEIKN